MAPAATAPAHRARPRLPVADSGPRYWLRGYRRTFAWDLADLRLQLPILASVLILQGAGFILGIGLWFRHIPAPAATFAVTGIPVVNLITAGLIFEPQIVADQRASGSYEFLQSMPVPRSMAAMAWYTVALMTALPAVAITLATGVARYLVFVVLLFSPVVYPITQLPAWLADVHRVLPVYYLAQVTRASVTTGLVHGLGTAYAVLAAWTVAAWALLAWVIGRRR